MRVALALAVPLLLLAGCNEPARKDDSLPVLPSTAPAPDYPVTIVVTQETPDGAPLQAKVQGVPINADGSLAPMQMIGTDAQGAASFRFRLPTTLLVRVVGADGWTSEGAKVHVDTAVAAEGLTVSDRDVFIPLFRSELAFDLDHAWSTAAAEVRPDGQFVPAVTFVPLGLPDGLQAAYLSRLNDAVVQATWTDSTDGRVASVAAGLAWDGEPWVAGEESSVAATGERTAAWDGDLPIDRPRDLAAATLQATLLTRTAVVGDVVFDLRTTLSFGGFVPPEMPVDDCHALLC